MRSKELPVADEMKRRKKTTGDWKGNSKATREAVQASVDLSLTVLSVASCNREPWWNDRGRSVQELGSS